RRGRTCTDTALLLVWPADALYSVWINGRTSALNVPSAAVCTVVTVCTCRPPMDGNRCSTIVTDSPAWPFATEPLSVTEPPYTTVDRLVSSARDFGAFAATSAVANEVALVAPALFEARTRTRNRFPTSTDVSV